MTFTPTANFNGPADFAYTAFDGTVASAPATDGVAIDFEQLPVLVRRSPQPH